MDITFVTPRLATGAFFVKDDVEALVAAGITDIIDCANEETHDVALLASHELVRVLLDGRPDDGLPKDTEWFGVGIRFALEALAQPNRKVLAHCVGGANRGPSMTYAIIRAMGFSAHFAEALITQARPEARMRYKGDAEKAIITLGYT